SAPANAVISPTGVTAPAGRHPRTDRHVTAPAGRRPTPPTGTSPRQQAAVPAADLDLQDADGVQRLAGARRLLAGREAPPRHPVEDPYAFLQPLDGRPERPLHRVRLGVHEALPRPGVPHPADVVARPLVHR